MVKEARGKGWVYLETKYLGLDDLLAVQALSYTLPLRPPSPIRIIGRLVSIPIHLPDRPSSLSALCDLSGRLRQTEVFFRLAKF